jgi:hypothetical protein
MVKLVCGLGWSKKTEAGPLSYDVTYSRGADVSSYVLKYIMKESTVMPCPFSMQMEETNDVSCGHILAFITICMLMASKKRFYFLSPFRHHKGCPHLQNHKKFLLKAQL